MSHHCLKIAPCVRLRLSFSSPPPVPPLQSKASNALKRSSGPMRPATVVMSGARPRAGNGTNWRCGFPGTGNATRRQLKRPSGGTERQAAAGRPVPLTPKQPLEPQWRFLQQWLVSKFWLSSRGQGWPSFSDLGGRTDIAVPLISQPPAPYRLHPVRAPRVLRRPYQILNRPHRKTIPESIHQPRTHPPYYRHNGYAVRTTPVLRTFCSVS